MPRKRDPSLDVTRSPKREDVNTEIAYRIWRNETAPKRMERVATKCQQVATKQDGVPEGIHDPDLPPLSVPDDYQAPSYHTLRRWRNEQNWDTRYLTEADQIRRTEEREVAALVGKKRAGWKIERILRGKRYADRVSFSSS